MSSCEVVMVQEDAAAFAEFLRLDLDRRDKTKMIQNDGTQTVSQIVGGCNYLVHQLLYGFSLVCE